MTLLPINKLPNKVKPIQKNALSGDVIDGGTITNFNSTGIKDEANKSQITIKDSEVVVENDLHIKGTVKVENLEYVQAQVPKLNVQKAMMIDQNEVIWKDRLGKSVTKSSLTAVGILKDLQVSKNFHLFPNLFCI